nr:hypothetical protein [Tanacetum cinerariifolium]
MWKQSKVAAAQIISSSTNP